MNNARADQRHRRFLPFLLFTVWIGGCGAARQTYTERNPLVVDMSKQTARTPILMTADKVQRPLYVVFDPAKVADKFRLLKGHALVKGYRAHLKQSLGRLLRSEFQTVRFVVPTFKPADGPHLIADVRVDGVEPRRHQAGLLVYRLLELQWAFAIRPSESLSYLYSFAGTGRSTGTYRTLEDGLTQATRAALHGLLSSFTTKKIHRLLKKLDQTAPPADKGGAGLARPRNRGSI